MFFGINDLPINPLIPAVIMVFVFTASAVTHGLVGKDNDALFSLVGMIPLAEFCLLTYTNWSRQGNRVILYGHLLSSTISIRDLTLALSFAMFSVIWMLACAHMRRSADAVLFITAIPAFTGLAAFNMLLVHHSHLWFVIAAVSAFMFLALATLSVAILLLVDSDPITFDTAFYEDVTWQVPEIEEKPQAAQSDGTVYTALAA